MKDIDTLSFLKTNDVVDPYIFMNNFLKLSAMYNICRCYDITNIKNICIENEELSFDGNCSSLSAKQEMPLNKSSMYNTELSIVAKRDNGKHINIHISKATV